MQVTWTGNTGEGTRHYRVYSRNHTIQVEGKPDVPGSADTAFRGDGSRYTPEDMLVAAISACHMLWYLHLCAESGIIVTAYVDQAEGTMIETSDGGGKFTSVTLKPVITITDPLLASRAKALHHNANKLCYIANSCNFPIAHEPEFRIAE